MTRRHLESGYEEFGQCGDPNLRVIRDARALQPLMSLIGALQGQIRSPDESGTKRCLPLR